MDLLREAFVGQITFSAKKKSRNRGKRKQLRTTTKLADARKVNLIRVTFKVPSLEQILIEYFANGKMCI